MKNLLIACLLFTISTTAQTQINKGDILPAGTEIILYLTHDISSKHLSAGDFVQFAVLNALTAKGKTIIAQNTYVKAHVANVKKARGGGNKGTLTLTMDAVLTTNNQSIPIFYHTETAGVDKRTEQWMIGMFMFGLALFEKGGEAESKAGAVIKVTTTQAKLLNFSSLSKIIDDKENLMFKKLIEASINPCGDRPIKPKTHNDPQYKQTKRYKSYKKSLREWEKCMGEK